MRYIAKVTCQSNMNSESANKQPTSKDKPMFNNKRIEAFREAARHIHSPPPPPVPYHKALPPRTTRADFITPDQRAIFGPTVVPFEKTDEVEADGL